MNNNELTQTGGDQSGRSKDYPADFIRTGDTNHQHFNVKGQTLRKGKSDLDYWLRT